MNTQLNTLPILRFMRRTTASMEVPENFNAALTVRGNRVMWRLSESTFVRYASLGEFFQIALPISHSALDLYYQIYQNLLKESRRA
jgi:hypothetical protein